MIHEAIKRIVQEEHQACEQRIAARIQSEVFGVVPTEPPALPPPAHVVGQDPQGSLFQPPAPKDGGTGRPYSGVGTGGNPLPPPNLMEKIVGYVRENPGCGGIEIREKLGLIKQQHTHQLHRARRRGLVYSRGSSKATVWYPSEGKGKADKLEIPESPKGSPAAARTHAEYFAALMKMADERGEFKRKDAQEVIKPGSSSSAHRCLVRALDEGYIKRVGSDNMAFYRRTNKPFKP